MKDMIERIHELYKKEKRKIDLQKIESIKEQIEEAEKMLRAGEIDYIEIDLDITGGKITLTDDEMSHLQMIAEENDAAAGIISSMMILTEVLENITQEKKKH